MPRVELMPGLLTPQAYPHPVARVVLVETHISWVLLTGEYAYKVKKPVKLPFLDYSTLDRRLAACNAELRLNRSFAPDLYLDVLPIAGDPAAPRVGGAGPPLEYCVRMRQFPQQAQLDRMVARGALTGADVDGLAATIAAFHEAAPRRGGADGVGTPAWVRGPVRETLGELLAGTAGTVREQVAEIAGWAEREYRVVAPTLGARVRRGFVREGHGDLHLANLVRLDRGIVPFDCIEFSAALRTGDVISDVAFLVMDLCSRGRRDLAWRFLNAYLQHTGDYDGVRVLHYYLVYRALVRAKVAMIRRDEASGAERHRQESAIEDYVALARSLSQRRRPLLVLMHGLSGSGKTQLSGGLTESMPAIRIRSDVERKRMRGLAPGARTGSPIAQGLYSRAVTRRTYAHLRDLAASVLRSGENAVVDAAFLGAEERRRFAALARRLGALHCIIDCQAPKAELQRRVLDRAARGGDASEAGTGVIDYQLREQEPLAPEEKPWTLKVRTTHPVRAGRLAQACRSRATAAS